MNKFERQIESLDRQELKQLLKAIVKKMATSSAYEIKDVIDDALPENICRDCFGEMTPSYKIGKQQYYQCWGCYESYCGD